MVQSLTYLSSKKWLFLPKISFINLKIFWILTISLIIVLSVLYIFQINLVISYSYQLQNYQKKLNQLWQENKILEVNLASANSLENIEKQIENLGFEKVDKVYYLQILENQVVKE